jgi:hypothetical protein
MGDIYGAKAMLFAAEHAAYKTAEYQAERRAAIERGESTWIAASTPSRLAVYHFYEDRDETGVATETGRIIEIKPGKFDVWVRPPGYPRDLLVNERLKPLGRALERFESKHGLPFEQLWAKQLY